jgi:hypothetical protein
MTSRLPKGDALTLRLGDLKPAIRGREVRSAVQIRT